jgi:hypothetical protein
MTRLIVPAFIILIAVGLFILAFAYEPAQGAQCNSFNAVGIWLKANGEKPRYLHGDDLDRLAAAYGHPGATRGLIAHRGGIEVIGLEVDGCILDPIPTERPSGRTPAGVFA